jgi:hypothetical protein
MRLQVATIALLAVVALELGARAQDEPDARAHGSAQELVDRGIEAFDRGRYQDAIEQFERSLPDRARAPLLYNIAQPTTSSATAAARRAALLSPLPRGAEGGREPCRRW